jgi:hypothetical protein
MASNRPRTCKRARRRAAGVRWRLSSPHLPHSYSSPPTSTAHLHRPPPPPTSTAHLHRPPPSPLTNQRHRLARTPTLRATARHAPSGTSNDTELEKLKKRLQCVSEAPRYAPPRVAPSSRVHVQRAAQRQAHSASLRGALTRRSICGTASGGNTHVAAQHLGNSAR